MIHPDLSAGPRFESEIVRDPSWRGVMMQEGTTLEAVLRRDRLIVLGGLVGI